MEYGFDSYGSISRTGFSFPCFLDGKKFFYGVGRIVCRIHRVFLPKNATLQNYQAALAQTDLWLQLRNSCVITLLFVMGTVISSSLTAYGFSRFEFKGKNVWFMLIISTMMLPSAVTLIPQYQMWNRLHLLGTIAPLVVPAWFGGKCILYVYAPAVFSDDSKRTG